MSRVNISNITEYSNGSDWDSSGSGNDSGSGSGSGSGDDEDDDLYLTDNHLILLISVRMFIAVSSLVLNALVLYIIHITPAIKTFTYRLIMNKSVTDILGVSCILFRVTRDIMELLEVDEPESKYALIIYISMMLLLWFSSALTCVAICVDRFMAVILPLSRFNGKMKNTKFTISLIWLVSISFTIPLPYIEFAHKGVKSHIAHTVSFAVCFYTPFVTMFVLYSAISYKLWMRSPPGQQKTNFAPKISFHRFGLRSRDTQSASGDEGVVVVSYQDRDGHNFMGHRNGKVSPINASPSTDVKNIAVELCKGDAGETVTGGDPKVKEKQTQRSSSEINKRRVTRMMFFLVLVNAVCWLPFSLVYVIKPWVPGFKMIPGCNVCENLLIDLASMDALVNPLLYFIMNTHFHKALYKMFLK